MASRTAINARRGRDLEARVRRCVVALLGVEASRVTPDARFREELGADSLDLIELLMAIEGEFDGVISDEDARPLETLAQVVAYIEARLRDEARG
ncbi:MAG: acyl carrier protein [Myxococcales bacterium]|nr:acyl carrier protein [Myxococcales bacterium]